MNETAMELIPISNVFWNIKVDKFSLNSWSLGSFSSISSVRCIARGLGVIMEPITWNPLKNKERNPVFKMKASTDTSRKIKPVIKEALIHSIRDIALLNLISIHISMIRRNATVFLIMKAPLIFSIKYLLLWQVLFRFNRELLRKNFIKNARDSAE